MRNKVIRVKYMPVYISCNKVYRNREPEPEPWSQTMAYVDSLSG